MYLLQTIGGSYQQGTEEENDIYRNGNAAKKRKPTRQYAAYGRKIDKNITVWHDKCTQPDCITEI